LDAIDTWLEGTSEKIKNGDEAEMRGGGEVWDY